MEIKFKRHNQNPVVGIALFVIIVVVGGYYYINRQSPSIPANQVVIQGNNQAPQPVVEPVKTNEVTLTIEGLYQNKQITISLDETGLQVLQTLNVQDPQLALSTKEYAGLGTLVDGMYGKKNGTDQKYWQYKVNGVMPQVGADAYKLKSGDRIEWLFGASQQ